MNRIFIGVVAVALSFCLAGCQDDAGARRALDDAGLSDVQITGSPWFGCSDNDSYQTSFKARNVRGKEVTGVVCSSWGKGNTIRYN